METNQSNMVGKTSQLVTLIVQCIAIIALIVTVILVLDRNAVCSFYEIPAVYTSLDTVSVIPIVVVVLLPISILIVSNPILTELKKDEKDSSSSNTNELVNTLIEGIMKHNKKEDTSKLNKKNEKKLHTKTDAAEDNNLNKERGDKKTKTRADNSKGIFMESYQKSAYEGYSLDKIAKSSIDLAMFLTVSFVIFGIEVTCLEDYEILVYGADMVSMIPTFIVCGLLILFYVFLILSGLSFITHLREEEYLYSRVLKSDKDEYNKRAKIYRVLASCIL